MKFQEYLESLLDTKDSKAKKVQYIKDYDDYSTDCRVNFRIEFYPGIIDKLVNKVNENGCTELEKYLKLYSYMNTVFLKSLAH